MLELLIQIYRFAEVYTVLLAWVVIPLGFFAVFLFFQSHYRMFLPRPQVGDEKEEHKHGAA
jgi:hypothetical protein